MTSTPAFHQQRGVWSLKDRAKSDDAALSETIAMEAEASEDTITDLGMPKSTDVINHGRSTVGPGGRCHNADQRRAHHRQYDGAHRGRGERAGRGSDEGRMM
jgi:hypothetical protein